MNTVIEKIGDIAIVAIQEPQLDISNADEFRRILAPVLQDSRNLVLDLEGVKFVDSRGCGVILSCLKQLSKVGGDVKLCCVPRPVLMVFELIRMGNIVQIVNTREEAVQAFQKSNPD